MKDENIGTHNSIERLKAPKERFSTYNSNYVNLEKMQINQEWQKADQWLSLIEWVLLRV